MKKLKSENSSTESMKKCLIKHRQLSLEEREELAKYAVEHGINYTANKFGKHYNTIKRWHDRYLNNKDFNNIETDTLTTIDHENLDSLSHLVGQNSLREIKIKYSLPFTIDTLAKYYKRQNIAIENKYLLILKCQNCLKWIRAINVYFGRPRNIKCPSCDYYKLNRQECLKIPFYNPRSQDYFFNRSLLTLINSEYYKEAVLPLLKIPKNLKCLLVYNIRPRKHNRTHIIKYFEKIGNNTIPVTYCNISFPDIQKRELFSPRSREFETDLICQTCQLPYFRDYKKHGDRYPDTNYKSTDPIYTALELFSIAKESNNKTAYTLMGLSKEKFYKLKKQYAELYAAIKHLKNGLL